MTDRGVLEYRGGEERLKILQNTKMHYRPPKPDSALSGMIANTEPRLSKGKSRMRPGGTREAGPQGAQSSWESHSSGRGNGVGWRPRSLLRSKDTIHPEPRPLLTRWFRRSLSICSSVNYPGLPPACLLW